MNTLSSISKVLITQSTLERIGGSEVQAYELAGFLSSKGVDVTIYTWFADSPMLDEFHNKGFRVIQKDTPEEGSLHADDFDLIWVQHEVLPPAIAEAFLNMPQSQQSRSNNAKPKPVLIFSHMSPFNELHIEFPYIYDFEERYSDLSVFNSESTLQAQQQFFSPDFNRYAIYPNPAPLEFSAFDNIDAKKSVSSILIVSNHRPPELNEAANILRQQGIQVDTLQDIPEKRTSKITSADMLAKYDVVVSIGKTVQYCLVMGKPVFVYDQFGGPGYLNDRNYVEAAFHNFSGRTKTPFTLAHSKIEQTSNRMSAQDIAHAIIDDYSAALQFHRANRNRFIETYSIESAFQNMLATAQSNKKSTRRSSNNAPYPQYVSRHMQMIADYLSLLQTTGNHVAEFYRQNIQIFHSSNHDFQATCSEIYGRLQSNTTLTITKEQGSCHRIDFGEAPCLIRVHATSDTHTCPTITSNAAIVQDEWLLFLAPDPQVYCDFQDESSITLTVEVFPLSHMSNSTCAEFASAVNGRIAQGNLAIQQWDDLMSKPSVRVARACYHRIKSMLRFIRPGHAH